MVLMIFHFIAVFYFEEIKKSHYNKSRDHNLLDKDFIELACSVRIGAGILVSSFCFIFAGSWTSPAAWSINMPKKKRKRKRT